MQSFSPKSSSSKTSNTPIHSPDLLPEVHEWATQLLVSDVEAEVLTRIESGNFRKLPAPTTTSGVLLENDVGLRIFLFPKDLAPNEPETCQLYRSRFSLTIVSNVLRESGFTCGKIDESCPWGPYFAATSPSGEVSYVYNLIDRYAPHSNFDFKSESGPSFSGESQSTEK